MAMQTAGDTQGTHRIPPSWTPGMNYAWRDFERDVANWVRLTDLHEEQHGPAVFQRLGGMAKVLAREIPEQVIAEGADGNEEQQSRDHRHGYRAKNQQHKFELLVS